MIIHINGWPGAGKKTIGELLASRLSARFVHNHLLHDVAIVCAGLDGNERWKLYESIRNEAYNALANRPQSEIFVMTNALCNGSAREREAWEHVTNLAIRRQVPLIPLVLKLDVAENCRRLESPGRVGRKLTDPAQLEAFRLEDTIQEPDVPELYLLDVTSLSPQESSDNLFDYVQAIRPTVHTASKQHSVMRTT